MYDLDTWTPQPLTLCDVYASDLLGLAYPDYTWGAIYANGF